jgi:hypothetical protein
MALYNYVHNPAKWTDPLVLAPGNNLITYPVTGQTPLPGARATAIDRAWALEHHLVSETGAGTRTWTKAEMDLIKALQVAPN